MQLNTFRNIKTDLPPVGLMRGDEFGRYFCTPEIAVIFVPFGKDTGQDSAETENAAAALSDAFPARNTYDVYGYAGHVRTKTGSGKIQFPK